MVGEVSVTLDAAIGPVRALVDRFGVEAIVTGNVGVANLDTGIKPPTGVGLTIEAAGVVTGGGVLIFDANEDLYAGAMQLSIHESITVKAFGLIATTRLPDGSRGYSLLVYITVEDFQPVPLGFGFMLSGIGGMVAIHRTFSEDALREGMQRDTLGTLLLPKDVINEAPALVRTIGAVFPIRTGSYLFGLLAKITWFIPTPVTMDLALIFEFGRQRRLLILGRISALLPSADNDLVRLILNAVGWVDFDQGAPAVDAVLVDSRVAHKFPLTGAAAFRARWTSGPGSGFILSVPLAEPRAWLYSHSVLASSGPKRPPLKGFSTVIGGTPPLGARARTHSHAIGLQ